MNETIPHYEVRLVVHVRLSATLSENLISHGVMSLKS